MANPCVLSRELRTIYLTGEIDENMAATFRRSMAKLNRTKGKITVEISSDGGDVDAGFAMVDTIRTSKNKVTTVATSQVMSAAVVVLASGHHRMATKHSNIMVHQGSFQMSGNYREITRGDIPMIHRAEADYSNMLERFTGRPKSYWEALWSRNQVYLTAEKAKELGIIDEILGW